MKDLGRVLPAMVTPFNIDRSVNYGKAAALANSLMDAGADGLVVTGTTGSSATLWDEEKLRLYQEVGAVVGKDNVICGTGSNHTDHVIHLTGEAWRYGFRNFLIVTPYYNKTSQEGVFRHFEAILEKFSDGQFIMYCVQGRTGQVTEPPTIAQIAKFRNLIGYKAADGFDHAKKVSELVHRRFQIYAGDDEQTFPMMDALGAYGVIGVDAQLFIRERSEMINLMSGFQIYADESLNMRQEALAIHEALEPLDRVLMKKTEPNPIGVRYLVNKHVMDIGEDRLPQVPPSSEFAAELDAAYAQAKERLSTIPALISL